MNIMRLTAVSILSASILGMPSLAMAQNLPAQEVPEGAASAPVPGSTPPAPSPARPRPRRPIPRSFAFVDQQFPVADANKDGTLTAAEFTAWAQGLKSTERRKAGQSVNPMAAKAYADGALLAADKNKDQPPDQDRDGGLFRRLRIDPSRGRGRSGCPARGRMRRLLAPFRLAHNGCNCSLDCAYLHDNHSCIRADGVCDRGDQKGRNHASVVRTGRHGHAGLCCSGVGHTSFLRWIRSDAPGLSYTSLANWTVLHRKHGRYCRSLQSIWHCRIESCIRQCSGP